MADFKQGFGKFTPKLPKDYNLKNELIDIGLLANSFAPVTGDIQSGILAANDVKQGNYGSAALNSLGLLPFVPALAGTFIGKGAKTWDALNHDKALKMADKGVDERTIWAETGNFKGADGHWRQEISDHAAKVQPDGVLHRAIDKNAVSEGAPTSFPQWAYMEHPEMYNAYEGTKKIAIRPTDDFSGGGSYNDAGIINISAFSDNPKSTNIHELQHAIQQREGWARGGSPESMRDEALAMLRRDVASGEIPSTEQAMAMLPMAQQNAYQRLAGEAEARATQARMNLTPQERRALFPFDSYDVPRENLIIRGLLGQ